MSLALSSLFTADVLASAFDAQCEAQALQGRTFPPLLTVLDGAYGLQVPAATATAIKYLNGNLFMQESAPKLAKGVGAKAAAVTVTQAMHAYAVALRAGMADPTKAPEVAPLPAWADPVAIAKAKADRKDARAAKANAQASADLSKAGDTEATADDLALAAALSAAPRDIHAEALAAWAAFAPFLAAGAITSAERDSFMAVLSTATVKADDTVTLLAA